MTRPTEARPADLALRYEWQEGSMPPPSHYEYTIRLEPSGEGEVVFLPDYPQHNPPVWTERFAADSAALDRLYQLMVEKGVFRRTWREMEHPPIGGSQTWVEVTAGGKQIALSRTMVGAEMLEEVFTAVRALVPETIWTRLLARRDQYERDYFERNRR